LQSVFFQAKAQQVVATAGGYYEGETLSLSFTVGEPVIETFAYGDLILTQGFQQPYNFYLQQILNVPMGWSGVSSYLDPMNKGVDGIFAPYKNDLIIMASMGGVYYPAQSINTIGNWNWQTGYQMKANNDFDLSITGTKIQNPKIELANGWNLTPVLSSCDVDVESLFSVIPSLLIVKEVAGSKVYWPAYNINTLGSLIPGKAYFVATTDAATIDFPQCAKSSTTTKQVSNPVNATPWNDLHYSAISHTIAFPAEAFHNSGILPGDVIGVFSFDGSCCGQAEISNLNSNVAITAFANDEITIEKDGFEAGEPFQFKVYRPETDQEFPLEVSFDPALPNMGFFAAHGLSAVKSLKLQATGISEGSEITFEVYPNPSHGIFNLSLSHSPQNLQIHITDIRGGIIREMQTGAQVGGSSFQIDLSGIPKGIYFLKLYDEGFVGMKKVVVE
jgi:hypothetical protein